MCYEAGHTEGGRHGCLLAAGLFTKLLPDALKKERNEVRKIKSVECLLSAWPHIRDFHMLCHSVSQQPYEVMFSNSL